MLFRSLLFGGNTATMHEGRITQFGPTATTYRKPQNLTTAQVFSEPPMNTARIEKRGNTIIIFGNQKWAVGQAGAKLPDGKYTIGVRPYNVSPEKGAKTIGNFEGQVLVTEISGSESVIHTRIDNSTWISQSHGIHQMPIGSTAKLYVDLDQAMFFDAGNRLVS